jgi:predicted ATPase/DNA-binding CsgD family transcriptional regulator
LALALGAALLEIFEDGVSFVDLSAIVDPSLVMVATAQVLGVGDTGQQTSLESVIQTVRNRQLLLILDNFEQVLEAAGEVADLLLAVPGVKMLVTSRAPLHISTEHEFPVPPLELPDRTSVVTPEGLTQYESVALFVQRAQAARPDFCVTTQNAGAVAEICARVDGLPLAIELAAARVKLLPPRTLVARLSSRLQLLTGGARDRPARQQTLRATIDWSHSLLDDIEKAYFRRLAVFSGGWTLDTAQAICGGDGDVVNVHTSLLDKSLLQHEETTEDEPRFRMLETIHEYALEQLDRSEEAGAIRRAHAEYFVSVAEAAQLDLSGPSSILWLNRLEAEHDNLRAAVRWSVENRNAELALRLCSALRRYVDARGHGNEGRRWLESALALDSRALPALRARGLYVAGRWAWLRGDYARAVASHEESMSLYQSIGDERGVASALQYLGNVAHHQEEYARAADLYQRSLTLHRSAGDTDGSAGVLNSLGVLARNQGDLEQARSYFEESLAIYRGLGDGRNVAFLLNNLARVARDLGDWGGTLDLCNQSLGLFSDLADAWGVALVLLNLGIIAQEYGDLVRAARLFGAAESLLEASTGSSFLPLSPPEAARCAASALATRISLGEDEFATHWRAGRGLTLADAVAEGRGTTLSQSVAPAASVPESGAADPLTAREREVARLMAEGKTNRQIGEALVITEWTVDTHVRHILTKLNLRSRAQVAAWAVERRLLFRELSKE